jgi:hypothetical protein
MNKLIEQLVNNLEFVQKIKLSSLNRLFRLGISSNSVRVRNKIKLIKFKHSIFDLTRLDNIIFNRKKGWPCDQRTGS